MIQTLKKFRKILTKRKKIEVIVIIVMMVFGAALECISISLVMPLLTIAMDKEIFDKSEYIKYLCGVLHISTAKTFMLLIIGLLIVIYILKNLYLFFEYKIQQRFVCNSRFTIQKKLIEVYLHRPFEFFLNTSTSDIARVIGNDTTEAFAALTTVLLFFTEVIISSALLVTIILIDPIMTISIASILVLLLLLIGRKVKPELLKTGTSFQKNLTELNKWVFQAIAGIKEIKVGGKEDYFIKQYATYGEATIKEEKKKNLLQNVPRLLIESVCISGLLLVLGIMIILNMDISKMIPQLSAFALVAVRLLPAANRMSSYINILSYQEPMLNKVVENLSALGDLTGKDRAFATEEENHVLECKMKDTSLSKAKVLSDQIVLSHITYLYPNSDVEILSDAFVEIKIGQTVGIIGTSGTGKTTMVDILLGLLTPSEGSVLVDGIDIREDNKGWLSKIGYVPQTIYLLDDTIKNNITFGGNEPQVNDEAVWEALKEAQLDDYVRSLPNGLNSRVGEAGIRLSGGQRQRIGIARALYRKPQVLILDEATSSLDTDTEAEIMKQIYHLHGKKTVIIITHRLSTLVGCDVVYRVEQGKIKKV